MDRIDKIIALISATIDRSNDARPPTIYQLITDLVKLGILLYLFLELGQ